MEMVEVNVKGLPARGWHDDSLKTDLAVRERIACKTTDCICVSQLLLVSPLKRGYIPLHRPHGSQ
jgi:hypothetical protein